MGNLKQRLIKAGRDYNYAEGVKVKATSAVYADQIVYVTASDGPYLSVAPADADGGATANGRLMIAKHDIPANGYGVVLPWKLVTNFDTSSGAVGDPVFLDDDVTGGTAGNLTLSAPTLATQIVVGRVTVDATAGAILVNAAAPETRKRGGTTAAGETNCDGRPMEQLRVTTAANTNNKDFVFDYPIVVTDIHGVAAGSSSGADVTVQKGTGGSVNVCTAFAFGGSDGAITRCAVLSRTAALIPAGTTLRVTKSANGVSGDTIIVTFIRG